MNPRGGEGRSAGVKEVHRSRHLANAQDGAPDPGDPQLALPARRVNLPHALRIPIGARGDHRSRQIADLRVWLGEDASYESPERVKQLP
jgi:hypothetical protein